MVGDITFENVSFRYGSRKDVFKELGLKIEKGKTTAIVGESGSGKTTLISLLQHIYPIQEGRIRIGDYDIAQIAAFVAGWEQYLNRLNYLPAALQRI